VLLEDAGGAGHPENQDRRGRQLIGLHVIGNSRAFLLHSLRNNKETTAMMYFYTIMLLVGSNVFMTLAWYGHLRFMNTSIWLVVIASWGVAFFEYCLQVPANRIGYHVLSTYQLKMLQEVITLIVFIVFAELYLGEGLKPKHLAGFLLLGVAAWIVFQEEYGLKW
jgi:uncharacterized protein (DUF486 family)